MLRSGFLVALLSIYIVSAQSYVETFDSNSLGWTECTFKKAAGTAIINEGVMTITSKGEKEALSALLTATTGQVSQAGITTSFEKLIVMLLSMCKNRLKSRA